MSDYTQAEVEYLNNQLIGRFATVGRSGEPQVAPVGVFYDPQQGGVIITGHAGGGFTNTQKWRNVLARPDVSFVIDDLASVDPWTPRGIEIRHVRKRTTTAAKPSVSESTPTCPLTVPGSCCVHDGSSRGASIRIRST